MSLSLRCQCGTLQGVVEPQHAYAAMTCYCKDCQAFARTLGRTDVLDAQGGTGIVAIRPEAVRFTAGFDRLACLSMSPKGLLRWYAACCNTPIANTPRGRGMPYAGMLTSCIATQAKRDEAFGPMRVAVNTQSARSPVKSTSLATFFAVVRIMRGVIVTRLLGRHRENPFFETGTDTPVREPRVLSREERASAREV